MDPGNLVRGATSEPIVIGSSAMNSVMNSVSTVASSSVIFLESPIILPNDQPDILQQALEAALPSAAPASVTSVSTSAEVPTKVSMPTTNANFVTVFNSRDGTLQLSQENARALGISANEGRGHSAPKLPKNSTMKI